MDDIVAVTEGGAPAALGQEANAARRYSYGRTIAALRKLTTPQRIPHRQVKNAVGDTSVT